MIPEVSISYLVAILRAFLLIIGHKLNVCMIASNKSGIDMKCFDGLKSLCTVYTQDVGLNFQGNITLDEGHLVKQTNKQAKERSGEQQEKSSPLFFL